MVVGTVSREEFQRLEKRVDAIAYVQRNVHSVQSCLREVPRKKELAVPRPRRKK